MEVDGWVRGRVCVPLEFQFLHQLKNLLFHPGSSSWFILVSVGMEVEEK